MVGIIIVVPYVIFLLFLVNNINGFHSYKGLYGLRNKQPKSSLLVVRERVLLSQSWLRKLHKENDVSSQLSTILFASSTDTPSHVPNNTNKVNTLPRAPVPRVAAVNKNLELKNISMFQVGRDFEGKVHKIDPAGVYIDVGQPVHVFVSKVTMSEKVFKYLASLFATKSDEVVRLTITQVLPDTKQIKGVIISNPLKDYSILETANRKKKYNGVILNRFPGLASVRIEELNGLLGHGAINRLPINDTR